MDDLAAEADDNMDEDFEVLSGDGFGITTTTTTIISSNNTTTPR